MELFWTLWWMQVAVWSIIWACIGAVVGQAWKEQGASGAVWCGLLGPFGLVILCSEAIANRKEERRRAAHKRELEEALSKSLKESERRLMRAVAAEMAKMQGQASVVSEQRE